MLGENLTSIAPSGSVGIVTMTGSDNPDDFMGVSSGFSTTALFGTYEHTQTDDAKIKYNYYGITSPDLYIGETTGLTSNGYRGLAILYGIVELLSGNGARMTPGISQPALPSNRAPCTTCPRY